jgi:hypothetical protein
MNINMIKRIIFVNKHKKGFAVLFSILLASFLITLGISIFNISLKEIQITTSIRDSQIAYYAADSARECAIYWDVKQGVFPTCLDSSCSNLPLGSPVPASVTCNGHQRTLTFDKSLLTYISNYSTDFFDYSTSTTGDILPVSDLRITKAFVDPNVVTTIQTWGHNTTIIGRRVERGIQQVNN